MQGSPQTTVDISKHVTPIALYSCFADFFQLKGKHCPFIAANRGVETSVGGYSRVGVAGA